jgi:hypothetical protein
MQLLFAEATRVGPAHLLGQADQLLDHLRRFDRAFW